jgi:DNA replication and repair protein RecF
MKRLSRIELINYRNYQKAEVAIPSDLVLIVGENASGKTNFLESIYFLSSLRSFRAPDTQLVRHNEGHFCVKAVLGNEQLEAVVQKEPVMRRGFKANGQKIKKIAWNSFITVLFSAVDINIFFLGPEARRGFLNEALGEKEKVYASDLASLEHVLKQRSALLQNINAGISKDTELEFWNKELADLAVRISGARRRYLEFISDRYVAVFGRLSGFMNDYRIIYKGLEEGITPSDFLAMLARIQATEIKSGKNLIGPHRDDFSILKDGIENVYNSSRGELREQVLTLKFLQAEYLTVGEDKPIMLLDDVFSELDQTRRLRLLENLKGSQVFITSTEPMALKENLTLFVRDNNIKTEFT